MEQLPEFPLGIMALFTILVAFITDTINDLVPGTDLPNWAKRLVALGTAETLCLLLHVDIIAKIAGQSSLATVIMTGFVMAATAAMIVHPLEKATSAIGSFLNGNGDKTP